MYASSPSWTFKAKIKSKKQPPTPSPDAYNPRLTTSVPKSPSYIIDRGARDTFHVKNTPAPNQYQPGEAPKSRKFGLIGQETKGHQVIRPVPGPGSYEPVKKASKKAFTMGKKYKHVDQTVDFPGPGRYQASSGHSRKGIILDRQVRFTTETKTEVPGPGRYETKRPNSASMFFSRSPKMATQPEFFLGRQYENYTIFDQNLQGAKGYSMARSSKVLKRVVNTEHPGPGAYSPTKFDLKKAPSPSMGLKINEKEEDRSPSPSHYTPKYLQSHCQTENYSMGKAQRKSIYNSRHGPGPGAYLSSNFINDGPQIFVPIGKREVESKENVPGPGAYHPKNQVTQKRPKTAKLGKSKRFERIDTETGPSPAEYQNFFETISPRYSFCKKKRLQHVSPDVPGPGCYEAPSTIANTPPYNK